MDGIAIISISPWPTFETIHTWLIAPPSVAVAGRGVVVGIVDVMEDEIKPPKGAEVVLVDIEDDVVVTVDPVDVVAVPAPPPPESGVCTQVDTAITLSSPFTVVGVNCTVHTWMTRLPLLWLLMSNYG